MRKQSLLVVITAALLAACQSGPLSLLPKDTVSQQHFVADLNGRVHFPARQTQATAAQVINQATISLIDIGGTTVATGVTDNAGNFSLTVGAFSPATTDYFVLEAVKGLKGQLPGADAPRFRSIVRWNGSAWLSITNDTAGGPIVINALTTAVAIESGLDPINVPRSATIGKVNATVVPAGLNASPGPYTNHPDTEILALANDITSYLSNDMDPVSVVNRIRPEITSGGVSPISGYVGEVVNITGRGFSPVAGGTSVTFNGVAASILMATSTRIITTVPAAATTGNIIVTTTRGGASNTATFTVPNGSSVVIESMSPNPIGERGTITITGKGFSTTAINNTVRFTRNGGGTTNGVVGSSSLTSLYVTLPNDAMSGNVTISVAPSGAVSNSYFLTVNPVPRINEVFPNRVTRYGEFYLYGENLGGTTGIVTIGNETATIKQWRNTWVKCLVPYSAPSGAQTVRVTTSDNKTITTSLTVLVGNVGAFTNIGSMPSNSGMSSAPAWTHKWLYIAGGGNGTNVARIPLDDTLDDGSLNLAGMTGNMGASFGAQYSLRYILGTNDLGRHWFGWTHPTKFWLATNNAAQKQYMAFDENTGNYLGTFDAGPANYGPAVGDSGCFATDKALYILTGGDTGGAATTFAYAKIHPEDGSIGPWVNHNNLAGFPSGDAFAWISGGNLFTIYYNNVQGIPINPDGSVPSTGWASYTTSPVGGAHVPNVMQAGDYLYIPGVNPAGTGSWPGGTNIWRAPIQKGVLLANNWTNYTASSGNTTNIPAIGAPIVIGRYMYLICGYGSSAILRAEVF